MKFRIPSGRDLKQALLGAISLCVALGLAGCGAGGGSDFDAGPGGGIVVPSGTQSLEIMTTSVPAGSRSVSYPATTLSAAGARGPVTWTVAQGALPAGMDLTADGSLVGTPVASGFYEFTVRASDGVGTDQQQLAVAVDTFGVTVVSGLTFNDAWATHPVTLRCVGFTGDVTLEVIDNESGGSITSSDGATGTSIYMPGLVTGAAVDLLRATDSGTGTSADIEITVVPDPTAGHVARFGSTDVWYLDFAQKHGGHPFHSDFHAALARVGLRGATSTGGYGSDADRLTDLLVRVRALQHINTMYLRNADGSPGARGLPISFPLELPAGYAMPAPGSYAAGSPTQFSVMAICDGPHGAVVGTAYTDGPVNGLQENNAPGGPLGALGTFVNSITNMVQLIYRDHGTQLSDTPVNDEDLPALKALLYGTPNPGGRYALLDYMCDAMARSVAYVAAHEIGHSLGLPHTGITVPGAIMNSGATFSPHIEYRFLPGALAALQTALPGAGRAVGSQKFGGGPGGIAALMPAGGVSVCNGSCNGGHGHR